MSEYILNYFSQKKALQFCQLDFMDVSNYFVLVNILNVIEKQSKKKKNKIKNKNKNNNNNNNNNDNNKCFHYTSNAYRMKLYRKK